MRLLLVEDDGMVGESVRTGLRREGFTVDWVKDGVAAELAAANDDYASSCSTWACRAEKVSTYGFNHSEFKGHYREALGRTCERACPSRVAFYPDVKQASPVRPPPSPGCPHVPFDSKNPSLSILASRQHRTKYYAAVYLAPTLPKPCLAGQQ
jgi:hypothetical protein